MSDRSPASAPARANLSHPAASFALAVGALAVAFLVVAACGGADSSALVTPTPVQPGDDDSGALNPLCPARLDLNPDTRCDAPEGTTCAFGRCSGRFATCSRGVWVAAAPAAVRVECPAFPPIIDGPCPPCWTSRTFCSLGCGADGRGFFGRCSADGGWYVEPYTCPAEDGGIESDGGRDAGPDAR